MDRQPVVCHTCTGVLLTTDSRDYTPQRGRLIVANGYCACPSAPAPSVQGVLPHRQQQNRQQHTGETAMVGA